MKLEPEFVHAESVLAASSFRGGLGPATIGMFIVFVWVTGWYWSTASEMASIWWRSDTFAHGLLVLPIFGWLVWRARKRISTLRPEPVPMLVVPAAFFGFAWLVAQLASVAAAAHFFLVAILVTCFLAVLGLRLARELAFPLLFLFFAVPVGEFLLPVMMHYTAEFTISALRLSGVPVFREGMHFVIPNGRWSVVEACSGLRYLIASLMVGALYSYLNYTSVSRRIKFMVVALAVPIVANWVRAYSTVMIGYLFGNEAAAGFIHIIYGWVFFGVVMFTLFWIGERWREAPQVIQEPRMPSRPAPLRRWLALAPLAVAVAGFPLLLGAIQQPVPDFSVALVAPEAAPGWAADGEEFPYRPHFRGQRGETLQTYLAADGTRVALHVAYFAKQNAGREMVMWGNSLVPSGLGTTMLLAQGKDSLGLGVVRTALVRSPAGRFAVWHWYWAGGQVVTSDTRAKLTLIRDLILRRPDDAAHVAVMIPLSEEGGDVRDRAVDFVGAHREQLERMLESAREERTR